MPYTDAQIDQMFAGLENKYVMQDGSTPITGEQTIVQIRTTKVVSDEELRLFAANKITFHSGDGDVEIAKNDKGTLTLTQNNLTADRTQNWKDDNGTIEVI